MNGDASLAARALELPLIHASTAAVPPTPELVVAVSTACRSGSSDAPDRVR
jgi:hypothetical protein